MSYGILVKDATGRTIFDSASKTFSFYTSIDTAQNTAGSAVFPELAGYTIDIQVVGNFTNYVWGGDAVYDMSVDYALGYPRVIWNRNIPSNPYLSYQRRTIYVFIKTAPAVNTFGFNAVNNDNECLNSYISSNYKFAGLATYSSQTTVNSFNVGSLATYNISTNGRPIVFVENLNDQLANIYSVVNTSGSNYQIRILKNSNAIPRVFVFERPTVAPSGYGLSVRSPSGAVLFDTSNNVVNPKIYAVQTVPATNWSGSIGSNYYDYVMPSTNLLSTSGTFPATSATCSMSTSAYYQSVNSPTGYLIFKLFFVGIKRTGNQFYSGWVCRDWDQDIYNLAGFPLGTNMGFTPRIFAIDISQYV
jgi:hypothetical protein